MSRLPGRHPSTPLPLPASPSGASGTAGERFRLGACLGRGGMGRVFRAEGPFGPCAVKVLHPHLLQQAHALRRFRVEAETGSRVRHPNVVRTYGVEEVQVEGSARVALVMELVEGETLAQALRRGGPLPEGRLRDLALQAGRGLAAIHAAGVVHRDLKPENLLLDEQGTLKILDLGVARLVEHDLHLSRSGGFAGSLLYAAPEVLGQEKQRPGPPADLYALGLVLYQLASGRLPFDVRTMADVLRAHLGEPAPPLALHVPQVSPFFEAVVATLLEKDPARRFSGARALCEVLELAEASPWWQARRAPSAGAPKLVRRRPGPLRGRAGALRTLTRAWRRAVAGRGQVVWVFGEAGVGKSRLIEAFLEGLDLVPGTVALAAADDRGSPLGAEGGRPLLSALVTGPTDLPNGPEREAVRDLLAARVPVTGPAAQDGDRGARLAHMVRACAAARARLLVVEDLDRQGPAARAAFAALARGVQDRPLCIVVTARTPAGDAREAPPGVGSWQDIPLRHLDRAAARALLLDLVGTPEVAEEIAPRLLPRAGGNPLYLVEAVDALVADGALVPAPTGRPHAGGPPDPGDPPDPQIPPDSGGRPDPAGRPGRGGRLVRSLRARLGAVPASIEAHLGRRLEGLPADLRSALEAGAIQGTRFDVDLASEALGLEAHRAWAMVEDLQVGHAVLRGEGPSRTIVPSLLRTVALAALDAPLRARLERQTGEALVRRIEAGLAPPEARAAAAMHLLAGEAAGRAIPWLLGAIDGLKARGSEAEAGALIGAALARADLMDPPLVLELLVRLAGSLAARGRRRAWRRCLARLERHATAHGLPLPCEAVVARARLLEARKQPRRARALLQDLYVRAAGREGHGDAARAAQALAGLERRAGSGPSARAWCERALLAARLAGDLHREGEVSAGLARLEAGRGRTRCARRLLLRALDCCDDAGSRAAARHGALGTLALAGGRFADAAVHLDRAQSLARAGGSRAVEAHAVAALGRVALATGRPTPARRLLHRALALSRDAGLRARAAACHLDLGRAALLCGDGDGALRHAVSALVRGGSRRGAAGALALAGEVAEERGDPEEARRHFAQAARRAPAGPSTNALLGLARTWVRLGQAARAGAALERARAEARRRRLPGPWIVAGAMRAALLGRRVAEVQGGLASLGSRLSWSERLETRLWLAAALGDPLLLVEARADLADLARDLGHPGPETLAHGSWRARAALGLDPRAVLR